MPTPPALRRACLLFLGLVPMAMHAQAVTALPPGSLPRVEKSTDLPPQMKAVFERMRAAYYHPGKGSLQCEAAIDWSGLLAKMGGVVDPERSRVLNDMRMDVKAEPEGRTEVKVHWPDGFPEAAKQQIEGGAQQMIGGFFTSYWSVVNADFIPQLKDSPAMRASENGGYIVQGTTGGTSVTIEIGADGLPARFVTDSAVGQDSVAALHFTPPADPKPGDRMRFTGVDATVETGSANHLQARMVWDYQDVSGVHIPHRVTVTIPGAFDVPFELSNCSVSTTVAVAPPK